jgi:hypothetical protein
MDDRIYWQKRKTEELAAAERATCPAAKQKHLELADRYRLRAEGVLHYFAA